MLVKPACLSSVPVIIALSAQKAVQFSNSISRYSIPDPFIPSSLLRGLREWYRAVLVCVPEVLRTETMLLLESSLDLDLRWTDRLLDVR